YSERTKDACSSTCHLGPRTTSHPAAAISGSITTGACGGAGAHRAARSRRITGSRDRRRVEHPAGEGRALAHPIFGNRLGGVAQGRAPAGPPARNHRRQGEKRGRKNHPPETTQCDSLEHADDGGRGRGERGERAAHLARTWPETALS